ncbi:MAG TPA: hypothetical protein VMW53_06900 [archaeon]|nr:hypothetical protein [archaeon]
MGSKDTKQESDKESFEMLSTILNSLDAVVYVVDMEHNGNIWAESEVGIGTTIHLILPK